MSKHIAKHLASLEEFEVESVDTVDELEAPVEPEVVDDEPVLEVAVIDTTGEVEEVAVTNDGTQVEIAEDVTQMDGEYQPGLDAQEDAVDQSLNELALQEQEIIDNGNDIDTAVEATIALEQYAAILYKCRRDGISQETAKFLKIGVDLAEKSLGDKVAFGIEDYEYTSRSSVMVASVSYEDFKEKVDGAKKYIAELWKKFLSFVETHGKNLFSGLTLVEAKFNKLKSKLKENGVVSEEVMIPTRLASRFAIDGKVEFTSLEDYANTLNGLVMFQTKLVPAIKKEIIDEMAKPIKANGDSPSKILDLLAEINDRVDLGKYIPAELKDKPTVGNLRVIVKKKDFNHTALLQVDPDLAQLDTDEESLSISKNQAPTDVLKAVRTAIISLDELSKVHAKVDELKDHVNAIKNDLDKSAKKATKYYGEDETDKQTKTIQAIIKVGQNQTMAVFANMREIVKAYNVFAAVLNLYIKSGAKE